MGAAMIHCDTPTYKWKSTFFVMDEVYYVDELPQPYLAPFFTPLWAVLAINNPHLLSVRHSLAVYSSSLIGYMVCLSR